MASWPSFIKPFLIGFNLLLGFIIIVCNIDRAILNKIYKLLTQSSFSLNTACCFHILCIALFIKRNLLSGFNKSIFNGSVLSNSANLLSNTINNILRSFCCNFQCPFNPVV